MYRLHVYIFNTVTLVAVFSFCNQKSHKGRRKATIEHRDHII